MTLIEANHVPGNLDLSDPNVWKEYMSLARFMDQVALSITASPVFQWQHDKLPL